MFIFTGGAEFEGHFVTFNKYVRKNAMLAVKRKMKGTCCDAYMKN